jgi:hypothetical protein
LRPSSGRASRRVRLWLAAALRVFVFETGRLAATTSMSLLVTDPALLAGLGPGQRGRFTIDAEQRAIVEVRPRAER